jgi:hypothetical protein
LTYYEERYRLTSRAAAGLAASVLLVVVGFLWHLPVVFLPLGAALAVLTAQGAGVIDRVRRTTAFRADQAGITLGAVPDKLTVRRGARLFIPWADVERIILYPVHPRGRGGRGGRGVVQCIGVQRRATAEPLQWGNEQAPGCPVPGVPAWATRMITGWRLDRSRLAAATAVVAPGVPILDTSTDPLPGDEDDGHPDSAPEAGPAA